MKCKVKMPYGEIKEIEIGVLNPNPLDNFDGAEAVESIQGTYQGLNR